MLRNGGTRAIVGVLMAVMCMCAFGAPNAPAPATTPPAKQGVLPDLTAEDWVNISLVVGGPLVLLGLWLGNVIRPGSLKAGGVRGVSSHPTWAWLMAALVAFVFAQAAGVGVVELAHLAKLDMDGERGKAMQALGYLIPGAAICLFLAYLLESKGGGAGLTAQAVDFPIGLGCLVLAVPVVLGAQIAATSLHHAVTSHDVDKVGHATLKALADNPHDPWVLMSALAAVLVAPIVEEFVYRGFLQSGMLRFTDSPGLSIVCTSAIFAARHWGENAIHTWYGLVPIFVLSLGLGIAFEKTKRIGVPIVMHILYNGANVAFVLLAR